MVKQGRTATITDVARTAGVSTGTVDRVVNNRDGVSEKTRHRILEVIDQVGYRPNIYASALSQRRSYIIIAVIPYFQGGEYWGQVYDGLQCAAKEVEALKVELKVLYYNQFDATSFHDTCRLALDSNPNGVVIAPIYREETEWFAAQLAERQIPVVYIDTRSVGTEYLAFYGMPMYESGFLAADLLVDGNVNTREVVSFTVDRGGAPQNSSMHDRRRGFEAYLATKHPDCQLYSIEMSPTDFLHNVKIFDSFFAEHPSVKHIVTFNSRAHLIADWMELRGIVGKRLIGFDALPNNIRGLKRGGISLLVAERVSVSAKNAIGTLVDFMVLHRRPTRQDNYSSLDILTKYNIEYYIE